MKYIGLIATMLLSHIAMSQDNVYPVELRSGLTILFPERPTVEENVGGFSKLYTAELDNGTYTVLIRSRKGYNSIPLISTDSVEAGSYIEDLKSDPNLGGVSEAENVIVGEAAMGNYFEMEWSEPASHFMVMILTDKNSQDQINISYQYDPSIGKKRYSKTEFIATVQG